ncbi:hypothetical protein [Flavobacterium sp. ENC]|uniref:hypothetical protein n=1 Tax=Flavobacterium sp. ENC TaxID=2897330 RepID=UPI001E44D9F5|nr:hypothetical protein [Flavobacterium sp. ENC]MCD0465070.1 hypothetical protein [Flavobacterium sp. ENC]
MKKIYITGFAVLLGLIFLFFYFKDGKVHILREYSPSGKLIKTHEYIIRYGDTILQGKFVNYNEKGIKIAEGQFLANEPNGIFSYYYDNGKLESVFYRKNGDITLESTYYNPNSLITKYSMCNDSGEPKFIIEFDDKAVKRYTGYVVYPVKQYKIENKRQIEVKTGDVLKVGDVIKYDYLLANIPNTKRTFKIETEGIDNSKVKRTISKEAPTHIIVEEVLTKKGLNRIKAITQYEFTDTVTPVKNDTVSFDINVK